MFDAPRIAWLSTQPESHRLGSSGRLRRPRTPMSRLAVAVLHHQRAHQAEDRLAARVGRAPGVSGRRRSGPGSTRQCSPVRWMRSSRRLASRRGASECRHRTAASSGGSCWWVVNVVAEDAVHGGVGSSIVMPGHCHRGSCGDQDGGDDDEKLHAGPPISIPAYDTASRPEPHVSQAPASSAWACTPPVVPF